jgi:hypothetical protein
MTTVIFPTIKQYRTTPCLIGLAISFTASLAGLAQHPNLALLLSLPGFAIVSYLLYLHLGNRLRVQRWAKQYSHSLNLAQAQTLVQSAPTAYELHILEFSHFGWSKQPPLAVLREHGDPSALLQQRDLVVFPTSHKVQQLVYVEGLTHVRY